MIVDFRLLVFVTVARELSFTRAAEELYISQPAVTKHIKELERLLSMPLFRRNGRSIVLTEGGGRVLPIAKEIISAYQQISDKTEVSDSEFTGRLRLGASTTISQYILPEILARFKSEYPRIEVTMISGNSEEILKGVEKEKIDLAMVEDAHSSTTFHYSKFATDRIILVSANKHTKAISVDELVTLPLVIRENGSGTLDVLERELSKVNIQRRTLNIVMQIGSSEGIVRYIKSAGCYAFLSEAAAQEYIKRKELYICDIKGVKLNRALRFATLHGYTNRALEIFREFCR